MILEMTMKCPHCKQELQKGINEEVIDFRCSSCGGHMMTISGLRKLCGSHRFADMLWKTARYGYSETGPVCGNCGKTMRQTTLPLAGFPMELDICTACQTVWVDPDELKRIPRPDTGPNEPFSQKAREVMAIHKVQTMEEAISNTPDTGPDAAWKYLAGCLGIPVEQNAPQIRSLPLLTWGTSLLCLLVFALTYSRLDTVIAAWGFIPDQWARKGGVTLISGMFLHANLAHLLGNLYFLLNFGDNVEDVLGKCNYLSLLIISGLSAFCGHLLFDPRSGIPCIGASGFISGIIVCYAVMFPHARLSFLIRNLYAVATGHLHWFSIPVWAACLLWIIFQGFMAYFTRHAGTPGGVAYFAHLGGALPGLLFGFWFRALKRKQN